MIVPVSGRAAPGFPAMLLSLFFLANPYSSAGSAKLPADNILTLVNDAARAQLQRQAADAGWRAPQFELSVLPSARPLAPCAAAVTVEPLDTRLPGRMRLTAVCPGADGWRYEFVVRAQISAMVAVAAAPLAPGQVLTAADMALERRDISAVADSSAEIAALAGLSSRRTLRPGDLLRKSQLAAPLLVRRGEQVRIVARREQIEVSMSGEALDAGALDAQVRVRNNASGNLIRARVTAAGTVQPLDSAPSIQSAD